MTIIAVTVTEHRHESWPLHPGVPVPRRVALGTVGPQRSRGGPGKLGGGRTFIDPRAARRWGNCHSHSLRDHPDNLSGL